MFVSVQVAHLTMLAFRAALQVLFSAAAHGVDGGGGGGVNCNWRRYNRSGSAAGAGSSGSGAASAAASICDGSTTRAAVHSSSAATASIARAPIALVASTSPPRLAARTRDGQALGRTVPS